MGKCQEKELWLCHYEVVSDILYIYYRRLLIRFRNRLWRFILDRKKVLFINELYSGRIRKWVRNIAGILLLAFDPNFKHLFKFSYVFHFRERRHTITDDLGTVYTSSFNIHRPFGYRLDIWERILAVFFKRYEYRHGSLLKPSPYIRNNRIRCLLSPSLKTWKKWTNSY